MVDFKELCAVLNGAGMSVRKGWSSRSNGRGKVTDSHRFRGARLSALEEAQELCAAAEKSDMLRLASKSGRTLDSLNDVHDKAVLHIRSAARSIAEGTGSATAIRDSIVNPTWNISTRGVDPSVASVAFPNVYVSPWEANSLYSQKGLFETVINKKSKSILLNGIRIENEHLSDDQIDRINERLDVLGIRQVIADAVRDSLVYGGCLVFPMFRKDSPVTTSLPLSALLRLGVLRKGCIDYFVELDRWNTFIIPPFNPTQKDFYRPEVYTVPFLGADVHHGRCARVVTAEQAGYWGQVITQGWGISDFCGYLQSGMNYKVAVQSLPLMIQQMSILARVVNVDGVLATEGGNALDSLVEQDTIRMRKASSDNPITLDVLGDIKSIDRKFDKVPELIRLLRQDFASDATIPEPMLFSSEKGNFASGDDTEGNQSKQWEVVKMIHKSAERQFSAVARILVIDALGNDDAIIRALPYTTLRFDEPVIANALERSQIGKFYSENVFNLVSAQIPIDIAVEMAGKNVSSDMKVPNDIMRRLQEIQARVDAQDKERFEMEMAVQEAQVESAALAAAAPSSRPSSGGDDKSTKGRSPAEEQKEKARADREESGYSRLEQRSHEKTRIGSTKRRESLSKMKNKSVS